LTAPSRAHLRAIPYRLPFARPFASALGVLHERRGFWLVATDDEGRTGFGEVAPLPEYGTETFDHAAERIAAYAGAGRIHEYRPGAPSASADPPAVQAGIELAFLDLEAQRRGVRICDLLAGDGAGEPRSEVTCNALLREDDPAALAGEAAAAVAAGYETVKVKIGRRPLDQDLPRVGAIRERVGPAIRIRADANGSWDVETAVRALADLERFDLEYVEQPVTRELAAVRKRSRVRIAADESVISTAAAFDLILERSVDVVVLKPMAIGGLRKAARLARLAREKGIDVVVTSCLDSAVGVGGALHLAAVLPASGPACGLATLDLFETMPAAGLEMPTAGRMAVPVEPGLGVRLTGIDR
jgi:L-Ala-D/L-Glu epimerase